MLNNSTQQPPTDQTAQQSALRAQQNGYQSTPHSAVHQSKKKGVQIGFSDKTLWDWMQLLGVFLIPLMIGAYTVISNMQQSQIAGNQHQETLLKTYIDDMTNLLLNYRLRESKPDDEVRAIAIAKTLTTLHQLDGAHKGTLMQFLSEANLIQGSNNAIINLNMADLRDAQVSFDYRAYGINAEHWYDLNGCKLAFANLENAKLSAVYLKNALLYFANLSNADLSDADLSYANLGNANLSGANLAGANLTHAAITIEQLDATASLKGTIMPDGTKHP